MFGGNSVHVRSSCVGIDPLSRLRVDDMDIALWARSPMNVSDKVRGQNQTMVYQDITALKLRKIPDLMPTRGEKEFLLIIILRIFDRHFEPQTPNHVHFYKFELWQLIHC